MKKKMCNCKACGAEIRTGAKFCQYCGAKVEKPLYKKWWFWLIIVAAIGAIGSAGDDTTAENTYTTPPTTQTATIEATEATTTPTEPVQSENEEESLSIEASVELWKTTVKLSAIDNYDYCNVDADETGAIVSLASDGFGEAVFQAKSLGLDENYEPWVEAKNSMIVLNEAFIEGAENFGLNDYPVMLILVNDKNYDDMLLIIQDDTVIYDCMMG